MSSPNDSQPPRLTVKGIGELDWEEFQPLIDQIRHKRRAPTNLFHYTDINGLNGLIETDALQASNVLFMNDSSEVFHSLDFITSCLEERFPDNASLAPAQFTVKIMFEQFIEHAENFAKAYVSCFCKKDDLLSQWRAYGDGQTCYSAKFSTRPFIAHSRPTTFLGPVEYDPRKKRDWANKLIEGALRTFAKFDIDEAPLTGDTLTELIKYFSFPFMASALFMKHEAFKEEGEWRLVHFPSMQDGDPAPIEFKTRAGIVVPYVDLRVQNGDGSDSILPLTQVLIGPSSSADMAKRGLLELLSKGQHSDVVVIVSETPLRLESRRH